MKPRCHVGLVSFLLRRMKFPQTENSAQVSSLGVMSPSCCEDDHELCRCDCHKDGGEMVNCIAPCCYSCEHCGKEQISASAILMHQEKCTSNPKNRQPSFDPAACDDGVSHVDYGQEPV